MNRYVFEFIGTFFLVFTVGMVSIDPAVPDGFAPIAIGTILAVMIFATGHISGGHLNPAVTLGVFIRGKISLNHAAIYWVVQLLAGVVAALVVGLMKPALPASTQVGSIDVVSAFLAEFLFTFALVFVVLNVATAKATDGNSYFGWAIGFTVLVGAYAVGGISGGVFNPAVALGGSIMNMFAWSNIWLYLVAQLLAGVAAAYVFRFAHPGE
ncbi:MAG: porin [Chloroflexi bacterium]|jgi:aquaporin Z|nr:porin [Chloroflexota bacterium]